MNKTTLLNSPQTLQDLQDFMFDTMMPAEMCVDSVSYTHLTLPTILRMFGSGLFELKSL